MRLLRNGTLRFEEYAEKKVPPYAILSHAWAADNQEVTFQEMKSGTGRDKSGYQKILFCQQQAARDGLSHFWVDSCCIRNVAQMTTPYNSKGSCRQK
jgi:hypothetical protein